jgi:hypothetical protein
VAIIKNYKDKMAVHTNMSILLFIGGHNKE